MDERIALLLKRIELYRDIIARNDDPEVLMSYWTVVERAETDLRELINIEIGRA